MPPQYSYYIIGEFYPNLITCATKNWGDESDFGEGERFGAYYYFFIWEIRSKEINFYKPSLSISNLLLPLNFSWFLPPGTHKKHRSIDNHNQNTQSTRSTILLSF